MQDVKIATIFSSPIPIKPRDCLLLEDSLDFALDSETIMVLSRKGLKMAKLILMLFASVARSDSDAYDYVPAHYSPGKSRFL